MTDEDRLCLIALSAAPGIGPAALWRLREAARAAGMPLVELLSLPEGRLAGELDLAPSAARAVASLGDPLASGRALLRSARQAGCAVSLAGEPGYPFRLADHLGRSAPPVLYLAGDAALLDRRCVAMVGSRRPTAAAARAARALARGEASGGATVVSGGARGIDTAAHTGALGGGATLAVPAVGAARFCRRAPWRRRRGPGEEAPPGAASRRWCVLGQFPPHAPWRTQHALMRNRTIAALSDVVIAFEPRDCGGTWHTSTAALAMGKPLFVVSACRRGAKGRGLRRLVRLGAVALDAGRMPDVAELARLAADYRPPARPAQTDLFGEDAF
jgi:DNA processing protein